jgi:hypothetical protein
MIYTFNNKKLKFENISIKFLIIGVVFFILLGFIGFFLGYVRIKENYIENLSIEEKVIILNQQDGFTPEKLKEYILELNIKFPHIVYAQSILETNSFKSNIFKTNNNLFGMKQARIRATTNQGTERGHATYKHWRESVVDYALFQNAYLNKITTEELYFQYLEENYAEDKEYVIKLNKIISQQPNK